MSVPATPIRHRFDQTIHFSDPDALHTVTLTPPDLGALRPGQNWYGIGIKDGVIKEIGASVVPNDSPLPTYAPSGHFVAPAFTDLHTHLNCGNDPFGIDYRTCGNREGVVTLVDAGSAGPHNFLGFYRSVLRPAAEAGQEIAAYLNIARGGLGAKDAELVLERNVDPKAVEETVKEYSEWIVGLKGRFGTLQVGDDRAHAKKMFTILIELAERVGLPVMVHIGGGSHLEDLMPLLRAGDVVTHCYNGGTPGAITDHTGKVLECVLDARKRGVLFDVGHGAGSFRWKTGFDPAMDQGFLPDTISTDIHEYSKDNAGPLPWTVSKLLGEFSLHEVLPMITTAPARAIRSECRGIEVGARANIVIGALVNEPDLDFSDVQFDLRSAHRVMQIYRTIRNGKVVS